VVVSIDDSALSKQARARLREAPFALVADDVSSKSITGFPQRVSEPHVLLHAVNTPGGDRTFFRRSQLGGLGGFTFDARWVHRRGFATCWVQMGFGPVGGDLRRSSSRRSAPSTSADPSTISLESCLRVATVATVRHGADGDET